MDSLHFLLLLLSAFVLSSFCAEVSWMGSYREDEDKIIDSTHPRSAELLERALAAARQVHNCEYELSDFHRTILQPICPSLPEIDLISHNISARGVKYRNYYGSGRGYVDFPYRIANAFLVTLQLSIGGKALKEREGPAPILVEHKLSIIESPNGKHIIGHTFFPLPSSANQTLDSNEQLGDRVEMATLLPGSKYPAEEEHLLVDHHDDEGQDSIDNSAPPPSQFKIVSYNIWNYNAPWDQRLLAIVEEITRCNPDIVALQEVRFMYTKSYYDPHKPSAHQITDFIENSLMKRLSYSQYIFQTAMTYLEVNSGYYSHVDEGVAILSKYPIISTDHIRLTRNFSDQEDEHQRVCLRASILVSSNQQRNRTVDVYVTHMSLSDSARRRNILEIWNFTNQHPESPQILTGDFNAEPPSESLQFLIGNVEISGERGNYTDAWTTKYGNSNESHKDGWTYTTLQPEPKKRIDFFFYRDSNDGRKRMELKEVDIVKSDPNINWNQHEWKPSDHRGLYAIFELKE